MKRKLLGFCLVLLTVCLFVPRLTYADDACEVAGVNDPLICGTPESDEETALQGKIRNALNTVYLWVGILAVIVIVIGGVKYMTSRGDSAQTGAAKNAITYSVVGLVVTLAAFAITNFFIDALDGRSPSGQVATEQGGNNGGQGGSGNNGNQGGGGSSTQTGSRDEVRAVTMLASTHLTIGDKAQLRATVLPDYAKDKTITWSTDNASVVSVDYKGNIVAKKDGEANIKATSSNGKSATTKVTVVKPIEVEKVMLEKTSIKINKGEVVSVKAVISPYNATNKSLTWKSSNSAIATVDSEGRITGKKEGNTTVTVTSKNKKTAKLSVSVYDPSAQHAIKITQELKNKLDYYYQTNYMNNSASCRSGYGGVTCGLSSYLALVKILTDKDYDYHTFIEEGCGTGFFNGEGASWDVVSVSRKSYYENKYGIEGKPIPNTWESITKELKKGHPMAILVRGPGGFRSTASDGMHYVILISYRPNNGGEVYAWNPVLDSSRLGGSRGGNWLSKNQIINWAINRRVNTNLLPWAAWKKK